MSSSSIERSTEAKLLSLISTAKRLNSTLSLNEILSLILEEAKTIVDSESSSLMLIDERTGELYFTVATGANSAMLSEIRVPKGKGVASYVADTGESVIINDGEHNPRIYKGVDRKTQTVTRTMIAVPLTAKGKRLGVLEVINKGGGEHFTEEDRTLILAFADFSAIAIINNELYDDLERRANEVSSLYQLLQVFNYAHDTETLVRESASIVADTLAASRVSVIVRDEDENRFRVYAAIGAQERIAEGEEVSLADSVLGYAYEHNEGVYVVDADKDEKYPFGRNKIERYRSPSYIVAPMRLRDEIVGFISATEPIADVPFTLNDLRFLDILAQQIAENFDHMLLSMKDAENERMEAELALTARMQQSLLPSVFETGGALDVSAVSFPAKAVGGDFYDFFTFGDGRFGFVIADVSGKGMTAALFMAISRSIIRVYFLDGEDPAKSLSRANQHIVQDSKAGMFVTCFICIVDVNARIITYANAGHFEQLLYRAENDSVAKLHTLGKPLGIVDNEQYRNETVRYENGDILLLYTDGVTEALNERMEQFGEERLIALLASLRAKRSREIVDTLVERVKTFSGKAEQHDDVTALAATL